MGLNIRGVVRELIAPIVASSNLQLVDVQYLKEGRDWFLRVLIDRPDQPIQLDDCTRISEDISKIMDDKDLIPGAYILEVSSPGAERPLVKESDFTQAVGKYIHISTYESFEGQKVFEGYLIKYNEQVVSLQTTEKQEIHIPRAKIAQARLCLLL